VVRTLAGSSFSFPLALPWLRDLAGSSELPNRRRPSPSVATSPSQTPNWIPRVSLYLPIQTTLETEAGNALSRFPGEVRPSAAIRAAGDVPRRRLSRFPRVPTVGSRSDGPDLI
jgi:hypothetical protein